MPLTDVSHLDLIEVPLEELPLPKVLEALLEGKVVVVAGYEATRGKDVLVRLDRRKFDLTQISFEVDPIEYGQRYWSMHEVSLNALSVHSVYLYDESLYAISHAYNPNTIVYFDQGKPDLQVAVIDKVFVDINGESYYTLDNEEGYYMETELTTATR